MEEDGSSDSDFCVLEQQSSPVKRPVKKEGAPKKDVKPKVCPWGSSLPGLPVLSRFCESAESLKSAKTEVSLSSQTRCHCQSL